MSLLRRAAKRDDNEPGIVTALRRAGCSVQQLSGKGVPDLLVGHPVAGMHLLEVKGRGCKLTPDQVEWHETWQGPPVSIVHTPQEALAVLLPPRPKRMLPEIE